MTPPPYYKTAHETAPLLHCDRLIYHSRHNASDSSSKAGFPRESTPSVDRSGLCTASSTQLLACTAATQRRHHTSPLR